jgi:hypothetical protein
MCGTTASCENYVKHLAMTVRQHTDLTSGNWLGKDVQETMKLAANTEMESRAGFSC